MGEASHDFTVLPGRMLLFAGKTVVLSKDFILEPVLKYLKLHKCQHAVVVAQTKDRIATQVLRLALELVSCKREPNLSLLPLHMAPPWELIWIASRWSASVLLCISFKPKKTSITFPPSTTASSSLRTGCWEAFFTLTKQKSLWVVLTPSL